LKSLSSNQNTSTAGFSPAVFTLIYWFDKKEHHFALKTTLFKTVRVNSSERSTSGTF